ncbi:MAG TPA: proprotein convertase P-domain-containing protein [Gemmataceae bacterium]|nr:proprotein convertase P-domain-containing protein [Gemmataceae bacterium]
MALEQLEDRCLLSVLPTPTVIDHTDISGPQPGPQGPNNHNTPAIAVDPNNPNKQFTVFDVNTPQEASPENPNLWRVDGEYSTNGGFSWNFLFESDMLIDPSSPTTAPVPFLQATNASISFDANDNVYILYSEHNAGTPAPSNSSALVLQKYSFSGSRPIEQLFPNSADPNLNILYESTADPAVTPMLAVDANPRPGSPILGVDGASSQGDPYSGNVYVAWSTNNVAPTHVPASLFNPNTIKVMGSTDGGTSFGAVETVNPSINFGGAERDTSPTLVVSAGTADGRLKPGQVIIAYDDFGSGAGLNPPLDFIEVNPMQGLSGGSFTQQTPAPIGTDPVSVNVASGFTAVSDLQVTVNILWPNLGEIQIQLEAPNGQVVTLLNNRLNAKGQTISTFIGTGGANMGVDAMGQPLGTTFDDDAARSIVDTINGASAPFIGHYIPENLLSAFDGLTASQVNGTWNLIVTDVDPDTSTQPKEIVNWTLSINSGLSPSPSVELATASQVRGALSSPYPLSVPADPTRGVGPDIQLASDNSLGSFSQHQGRLYLVYVGHINSPVNPAINTDIELITSDNGGLSWSSPVTVNNDDAQTDGFSGASPISGRPQFDPAIAVDNTTGTVVITFYDARNDPSSARVAQYIATSIDGGKTFGAETFLNTPQVAFNAATASDVVIGPIPDNESSASGVADTQFAFGDREGLAVSNGRVYAVWAGNLNGGTNGTEKLDIFGAIAEIPAGPRIISSTMGPVTPLLNNTYAADGTELANTFDVQFDRYVDPSTFTTSQVTVVFRNTTTPTSSPGVNLTVLSVTPLDSGPLGATQFRIKFDPTNAFTVDHTYVGTYSYSVGPNIQDRIPSDVLGVVKTGNKMDQNANGVAGQTNVDAYAAPQPLNGIPFQGPYNQQTLPLIVPGPHIVSTSVAKSTGTAENLVLNNSVSGITVVFDRDMNPASFTPSDVLRVMGPTGLIGPGGTIPASFQIVPNPNGNDPNPSDPRTYLIKFQTLLPLTLSGTYTVTLASSITSAAGDMLDTNENAGVSVLFDTPTAGTTPVTYSTNTPVTIGSLTTANSVVDSPITVADNYVETGSGIAVQLNIAYRNDPDLTATLIAPDGTTMILLFANVGNTGSKANFTNTVLQDSTTSGGITVANSSITTGAPPFTGRFAPQTPLDSLGAIPVQGTWTLEIADSATGTTGTLLNWSLTFLKPLTSTGLGEPVADQATVSFRIFTMDPSNPLSRNTWTAVGPASIDSNGQAGVISALAVDPSDPSGNTVYIGGANGGVWKTTDFLTTNPAGPTWIPLTNFGPDFAINIGSIAIFGRNNDPNQSIIIAATGNADNASTGSGDYNSAGVGFLRSMDGGVTWTLLDSISNVDSSGNPLPLNQRTHDFVGTYAYKVLVDPRPTPSGNVIIYAALGGTKNDGVWRSTDSGNTWVLMRAGQATDIVLDPNSGNLDAISDPTGNLEVLYAAFQGSGVYISPNQGQVWEQLLGTTGDPLIQNGDLAFPTPIPVGASASPDGAKGRIVLGKPALTGVYLPDGTYTGNPVEDLIYEGWLYALVVGTNNQVDGLYMTKDFGQNWTRVDLNTVNSTIAGLETTIPTNDPSQANYSVTGIASFAQGNYDVSIGVDPTNPNIVYLGGTTAGNQSGFIRVDTTKLADAHAFLIGENVADGGRVAIKTTDPVTLLNWPNAPGFFINPVENPIINLIRDPNDPFNGNSTIFVSNIAEFDNNGTGATWIPFDLPGDSSNQHGMEVIRDPLTGLARLVIGDDNGIYTAVDDNGTFDTGIGTASAPIGTRDGNLQITQFFYGAAQPSNLAASIAQALFYGMSTSNGYPQSDPNILSDGNLQWTTPTVNGQGSGTGVATDQTGTGTLYQYTWPVDYGTNFFQVTTAGGIATGRTFGLVQQSGNGNVPDPQWPSTVGSNFAVNPIDGNEIIISSQAGRIFGTSDQARTWLVIGDPTALDGTYAPALAFGAPIPSDPTGALNDFLYAGTNGGHIYVTFTGGGANGNQWVNISGGLDGSPVREIITDPTRGKEDAFAVTLKGVYYMPNAAAYNSNISSSEWQNITGNLFAIAHNLFTGSNGTPGLTLVEQELHSLQTIQADWRYAIPNGNGGTYPVLYVGGDAGVYRSINDGQSWTAFPDVADDGAAQDGGYLPNTDITDLTLVLGNVDPTTGHPVPADSSGNITSPDVLLATTGGQGSFAIRLAPIVIPNSLQLDPTLPPPGGSDSGVDPTHDVISVLNPVIDGISEAATFGNFVEVHLYDLTPGHLVNGLPPEIGSIVTGYSHKDPTTGIFYSATDSTGEFKIQVENGHFLANGDSDGVITLGIQLVDPVGVVSNMYTFQYTLDTAPVVVASSIHLDPNGPLPPSEGGSDTGLSFTDGITYVTNPIIDGQVVQAAPLPVNLYDVTNPNNPILLNTLNAYMTSATGTFSIPVNPGIYFSNGTTDGVRTIEVVAEHGGSSGTADFQFTLLTVPPPTPATPTLDPVDLGTSTAPNVTDITTPDFLGNGPANDEVQLFANGVEVGTDIISGQGTYRVEASSLANGTYQITVRLEDVAGNLSGFSPALSPPLVVQTTGPSIPTITLDPTYVIGGPNTSAVDPTLYDGTVDKGDQIAIMDDNSPIDTFTATSNSFSRFENLGDGTHTLVVQATDQFGHVSNSFPLTVTINLESLDPDRKFVRQLYFDDLGRPGALPEWNLWLPVLSQTNGRTVAANDILRSPEARDYVVKGWYQTYLGRAAVNGEEQVWVNQLLAGATEEHVLSEILSSTEYLNHTPAILGNGAPASSTTFIEALYSQLLNRNPGANEVKFWLTQIPTLGRQGVALEILMSVENRSDVMVGYYKNLLRRPTVPSQIEINDWVFSGLDFASIRVAFEGSEEYFFRVTGFIP